MSCEYAQQGVWLFCVYCMWFQQGNGARGPTGRAVGGGRVVWVANAGGGVAWRGWRVV